MLQGPSRAAYDARVTDSPYAQLDALAAAFGLPPPGATLAVQRGGLTYAVELAIDSGVVRGLTIAVVTPSLPALRLSRESGFDRLGKAVGLAREVQVGDPGFDPRVYIEGDDVPDAEARAVLAPPAVRRAVVSLLERVEAVCFGPDGVRVEVRDREGRSAFDPAGFRAIAADLAALVGALPAGLTVTPKWAAPVRGGAAPAIAWVAVLCVGWCLAGILHTQTRFVERTLTLVVATAGGAPLWLASLVVLFFGVRGKSTSTSMFAIGSLLLAIALLPLGAGVFMLVNGLADTSPRVTHRARILSAEAIACEEPSAFCGTKVEVALFGDARVEIHDYTFPKPPGLVRGGKLDVVTRAGALGCAYVVAP